MYICMLYVMLVTEMRVALYINLVLWNHAILVFTVIFNLVVGLTRR